MARALVLALAAVAVMAVGVAAVDKESQVTAGGATFYTKVLGQSGKIRVGNTQSGDSGKVCTIEMDSVREVDSAGNSVGGNSHGFNSFASKDFSFSNSANVIYLGLNATNFNFTATDLQGTGKGEMIVSTYLFTESGTVTIGQNEAQVIEAGMLKFNVNFTNWEFCDASVTTTGQPGYCKQGATYQTGQFIDFKILVKGKKDDKLQKGANKTVAGKREPPAFEMGDGMLFSVSTQVEKDGAWEDMADGYPDTTLQGSKTIFTFRFPKFTNYAFYDPSVDLGNSALRTGVSALLLACTALLAMFSGRGF